MRAADADSETEDAALLAAPKLDTQWAARAAQARRCSAYAGVVAVAAAVLAGAATAAWLCRRAGPLRTDADGLFQVKAATCTSQENMEWVAAKARHIDHVVNPEMCCMRCRAHPWCTSWTFVKNAFLTHGIQSQCWLKDGALTGTVSKLGVVSGIPPARLSVEAVAPAFACQAGQMPSVVAPNLAGAPLQIKVLTYNLEWWKEYDRGAGAGASGLIRGSNTPVPYDAMGFQECEAPDYVLSQAGLAGQYAAIAGAHSLCMAYRKAAWAVLAHGQVHVGADRQFGKRDAQWMRLQHRTTRKVLLVVNHHGPLPLNSGGVCGGASIAFNLLTLMQQQARPGDAVVLVGDFNAGAGSATIQQLNARLHHVSTGAKDGGIDNIFTNLGPASVKATNNLGSGGSDHDALAALLQMGGSPSS